MINDPPPFISHPRVPSPEAPRSPLHEVMIAGRMMEAKQRMIMRQQRKARDRRRRERKRAARSREFNREFKNTSSLEGVLIGPGCSNLHIGHIGPNNEF